jgi:NAD(P)H-nitrite reductase large subunit
MKKVVIIGSGMAGVGLAQALKKATPDQDVTIVTSEAGGHYSRPLLSHGFSREEIETRIVLKSFEQLRNEGISIRSGAQVTGIERGARTVAFTSGTTGVVESIGYDQLVLATGSEAFIPPSWANHRGHFMTLNHLEDLKALRLVRQQLLARGKTPHWAIIGGGLIGCELAADVNKAGDPVDLFHATDRLMERQLDPEQSGRLLTHFGTAGIRVELSQKITGFYEAEGGKAIQVEGGRERRVYDLILVATGFKPRSELAKAAGLEVGQGIITDEFLRTADPWIYALGDVAQVKGERTYAFVAPIRHQAQWLAAHLSGLEVGAQPWVAPSFSPLAKIHGFRA